MKKLLAFAALSALASGVLGGKTFNISSVEDFKNFTGNVNQGINDYSRTTVRLTNSLDFGGGVIDPIGKYGKPFKGTFDGQGYRISNLNMNSTEQYVGLFGYTGNAKILNVILDDSCYINPKSNANELYVSGICGYCTGNCRFENCTNFGAIDADLRGTQKFIGGILGGYGNGEGLCHLKNNINYGPITYTGSGNEAKIGGVLGNSIKDISIKGCANFGKITVKLNNENGWVGGIVGYCNMNEDESTIESSTNYGEIFVNGSTSDFRFGGIAGELASEEPKVISCSNFGSVHNDCKIITSCTSYIGGIVGLGHQESKLSGCISDGLIISPKEQVAIGPVYGSGVQEGEVSNNYYNEAICKGSNKCSNTDKSSSYTELNNTIIGNTGSNQKLIMNPNGTTLTIKANCKVVGTFSTKTIVLPPSTACYSDPGCTNIFNEREITRNTTVYQRVGTYQEECDDESSSISSSSSSSSSSPLSSSSSSSSSSFSSSSSSSSFSSSLSSSSISSSSSSSSSISDNATNLVVITFSRKDLTEEDITRIIRELTGENYTIERFGDEDGHTIAIIKFEDVESARSFVETIKSGHSEDIGGVGYTKNIPVISLTPFLGALPRVFMVFLSLFCL